MLLNNGIITRSVISVPRGKSNGNLGKNGPNYEESVEVVTERAERNR